MSKAGKRLVKAAKQARKIAVTASCGCVYCDLEIPRYSMPDGRVVHDSKTSAVHTCTFRVQPHDPSVPAFPERAIR